MALTQAKTQSDFEHRWQVRRIVLNTLNPDYADLGEWEPFAVAENVLLVRRRVTVCNIATDAPAVSP